LVEKPKRPRENSRLVNNAGIPEAPAARRTRRVLGVLALALGATALALGVAEVGLRVAHLRVSDWRYNTRKYQRMVVYDEAGRFTVGMPHAHAFVFGTDVRFNAHGMRDLERVEAKPPGARRVLVLGDSNVAGMGVAEGEMLSRQLEPLLNARAGPRVEVLAGAVAGWNTVAERNWLRSVGLAFAPDLIVLVYAGNDNDVDLPWSPRPPASAVYRAWQWLADHSRLVELATYTYRQYHPLGLDAAEVRALGDLKRAQDRRRVEAHHFEPDDPGWLASRDALRDIARLARDRGIGVVVVSLSFGGGDSDAVIARLGEFSRETGVPVLDTRPWFAGRPLESLLNAYLHPNAAGHAILAAGIARVLADDEHLR
jgi:lysophospholipase L1-like esterase